MISLAAMKMIWALNESNAIEGVYDAQSLVDACEAWHTAANWEMLSTERIKRIHQILMYHQPLAEHEKGHWRTEEVTVGGARVLPAMYLDQAMDNWLKHYPLTPRERSLEDEEWRIQQAHIEFEKIHPFVDGNGRVGRLLMNWQRVRNGLDVLIIKESEKEDYYDWWRS